MLARPEYNRNDIFPFVYEELFIKFKIAFPSIKINIVGSIRRNKSIIHDIDIIIASRNKEIFDWFIPKIKPSNPYISYLNTRIDGFFHNIPIQIWFCDETEYGPYLLLKTGPNSFNRSLASIAKNKGMTLSEHGLFLGNPDNRGKRIDENTESSIIWNILGCKWIHPERRY